jgi:NADH dehydrogenase
MVLLTGSTGLIGSAVLGRLLATGVPVRCLVRDPRRLGGRRMRVQIALGDLADRTSFRNAMRGVDTVLHLAGSVRDQPRGSIEELNGIAAWHMVKAAERAGVRRFLFVSRLGAATDDRSRLLRAMALAESVVLDAALDSIVVSASLVYAPGDRALWLLQRRASLPVLPIVGSPRALFQPIWAEDVAACVLAALGPGLAADPGPAIGRQVRHELAGPQTLSQKDMVRLSLASLGRRRRVVYVPELCGTRSLGFLGGPTGSRLLYSWADAEVMFSSAISANGVAGARVLGVEPKTMQAVLQAAAKVAPHARMRP